MSFMQWICYLFVTPYSEITDSRQSEMGVLRPHLNCMADSCHAVAWGHCCQRHPGERIWLKTDPCAQVSFPWPLGRVGGDGLCPEEKSGSWGTVTHPLVKRDLSGCIVYMQKFLEDHWWPYPPVLVKFWTSQMVPQRDHGPTVMFSSFYEKAFLAHINKRKYSLSIKARSVWG